MIKNCGIVKRFCSFFVNKLDKKQKKYNIGTNSNY